MIISYPILPDGCDTGDEEARLQTFLDTFVDKNTGFYPVSFEDRWHGGIHLLPGTEPVRAIADGEVICFRAAAQPENYPGVGDYDTSFVLLKHTTETGENTPVVFYSLLMHLRGRSRQTAAEQQQLPDWLRQTAPSPKVRPGNGQRVWRKDVLGFAGVYADLPRVHFEIFTTDTDLGRFWKDSTAIAQGSQGSTDFFGDAGFVIPSGKSFQARHPHADAQHHQINFAGSAHYGGNDRLPVGLTGASGEELYVSVRLARGHRRATTYHKLPTGAYAPLGDPVIQVDYEYELYRLATALYRDCPSAGFEWLRFGRMLGPDTTTTNENWQLIRYGMGASDIGYIDLASAGNNVTRLSDADFPFWLGWQKITEGTAVNAQDGICDVQTLLQLLHQPPSDPPAEGTPGDAHQDFIQHANSTAIAEALRFLVVQHPSEWDDSDLDTRYARDRQQGKELVDDQSWTKFTDHVKKMAFWSNTSIDRSVWHFHPVNFVFQYRKCLWLSEKEIIQCLPRSFIAEYHRTHTLYRTRITHGQAQSRTSDIRVELNKMTRKFVINSTVRLSCFLANAIVESSYLSQYFEGGRGAGHSYGDWYGRGIIQLTHEEGYLHYFEWRGWSTSNQQQNINHRDAVETDNHERTESAGYWWAKNKANRTCDTPGTNAPWNVTVCENFNWHTHSCVGAQTRETRLSNSTLDLVARHVNTGSPTTTHAMNGLPERRDIFINDQAILTDMLYSSPTTTGPRLTLPAYLTRQS